MSPEFPLDLQGVKDSLVRSFAAEHTVDFDKPQKYGGGGSSDGFSVSRASQMKIR